MTAGQHIFYWSPGAATQPSSLGTDDHYFRLGVYVGGQEPGEANVGAEGIYFYTSGKYSLKSTDALHMEVVGPVTRTVETGDWTYSSGDLSITATEGAVTMTAKENIDVNSDMTTVGSDDTTSITISGGATGKEYDVYLQQAVYVSTTTEYEEKIVNAHAHKTNIGILLNTHAGAAITNSFTFELSFSSFGLSIVLAEIVTTGVAINIENIKQGEAIGTMSFTFYEGKKILVDEEYCGYKNEFKNFRLVNGLTGFGTTMCDLITSGFDLEDNAVKADIKKFSVAL